MSAAAVFAEALEWVGRAVKLIPVIRQLWDAVKGSDQNQQLAAQLEMVRTMREMQAREMFALDEPEDTPTSPCGR
jgi:hypothetical protein